jgi:hypothetical protein
MLEKDKLSCMYVMFSFGYYQAIVSLRRGFIMTQEYTIWVIHDLHMHSVD